MKTQNKRFNRQKAVVVTAVFLIFLCKGGFQAAKIFLFTFITVLFVSTLIKEINKWRIQRVFRGQILLFLRQLALNMQTSRSFRASYKESLLFFKGDFRKKMEEVFQFVTFSQQIKVKNCESFEKRVVQELIRIDKDNKQSARRLKNFQTTLELEEYFRHRSKQMANGVRLQLVVLALIYLGIGIFIVTEFGMSQIRYEFLCSMFLFGLGCVVFLKLGEKKSWKL